MVIRTVLVFALVAVGCGKNDSSDSESTGDTPDPNEAYAPVEGSEATPYLASAYDVVPADADALSKSLALAEQGDGVEEEAGLHDGDDHEELYQADTATLNFMKSGEKAKLAIDTASFPLPSAESLAGVVTEETLDAGLNLLLAEPPIVPETFNPKTDKVLLDAKTWDNKSEIKISRLTQIPVKDQGQRGTCAAHTGVSAIEYLILKKHNSRLSTIDLSEQRFYMMSKQELWKTGGVTDVDGGSAWYNGYNMSMGEAGVTVPSNSSAYNIPLEKDCAYNAKPGKNELQISHPATCKRGSVKVTSMSSTYYYIKAGNKKEWHSDAPRSAQEIFNFLKTKDLPVPTAAQLTDGWMKNDGMITYAKSKGQKTQGGHAFLIVGARKIDEKKYPGEGGMCFIIKNSWTTGWGQAGYSCMTLTWFNNFRRPDFYDIAFDVNVDLDYVAPLKSSAVPAKTTKAKLTTELEDGDEGVPTPVEVEPTPNPGTGQEGQADTETPATAEAPGTTEDGFTVSGIVESNGNVVKAFHKVDGAKIEIVGILKGEDAVTQALSLDYDAASGKISYTDAKRGAKTVGELKDNRIKLCSAEYAEVCHLNYVVADKRLVLGLTESEFRTYPPNPEASYTTLASYSGYGIEFALAGDSFADFRLMIDGQPTNAIRLKVDAVSGAIQYKGKEVGNYQKLGLCSGDYRNVCRIVVNSEDKSLNIFFKMQ